MKRIIFILAGIACIVIGIFALVSHFNIQKVQTGETVATIIRVDSEMETDSDGFDTRWYYPVVGYSVNEEDYETRVPDSGTTNSTDYKEGQTIEIKYNPDKPEEISKKGNNGGFTAGIIFIIFGLIVIPVSLFGRG